MSDPNSYTRRRVIRLAAQLPVVGAVGGLLGACDQKAGALCADPDDMNFSEASIRKVNNYTESSPEAAKNCLNCAHFTAQPSASGETPSCGQCAIFEGPANKDGYCDSWSEQDA